jgi:hypothetical protein
LFEYVRVAEKRGFEGVRLVVWLVLADAGEYGRDFIGRETERKQELFSLIAGVDYVIPLRERGWIFRTMAYEHSEIMQVSSSEDDVVLVEGRWLHERRDLLREGVEPRLVAVFMRWGRFATDVLFELCAEVLHG